MRTLKNVYFGMALIALTASIFLIGTQWERRVLAPHRRKAAMAKMRAHPPTATTKFASDDKPCLPCDAKVKAEAAKKLKPAAYLGDRKIIQVRSPVQACQLYVYVSDGKTGVLNIGNTGSDPTELSVVAGIACGATGNTACTASFSGSIYAWNPDLEDGEGGWDDTHVNVCYSWGAIACDKVPIMGPPREGIPGVQTSLSTGSLTPGITYGIVGGIFNGRCSGLGTTAVLTANGGSGYTFFINDNGNVEADPGYPPIP